MTKKTKKKKKKERKLSQIYALLALHLYKTWKLKNLIQAALLEFSESHLPYLHEAIDNNLELPTCSPAVFLRWGRVFFSWWHLCATGRSVLSCIPSDPPAGVFACPGRLLYVSLWKTHCIWPVLIQIFIISFPACLLNDREKCFTCCWDSIMARQNSKLYHAL